MARHNTSLIKLNRQAGGTVYGTLCTQFAASHDPDVLPLFDGAWSSPRNLVNAVEHSNGGRSPSLGIQKMTTLLIPVDETRKAFEIC